MLAAVLQSPRAVRVSIEVVRAFVRLRAMLARNAEPSRGRQADRSVKREAMPIAPVRSFGNGPVAASADMDDLFLTSLPLRKSGQPCLSSSVIDADVMCSAQN